MSEPESRSRRRGVRASRVKLNKALAAAGLKTQAALAQRIADLEGTESAPKDVVSRVFREQPADFQTLERIARGLGVEAHTLYLTSDEDAPDEEIPAAPEATNPEPLPQAAPPDPETSTPIPQRDTTRSVSRRHVWVFAIAGLGIALAALLNASHSNRSNTSMAAAAMPQFGQFKVVVSKLTGDTSGEVTVALIKSLKRSVGVASPALEQIVGQESATEVARRMRADMVVDGELAEVGQLLGIRIYAYAASRDRRELIWSETFPSGALGRRAPEVAAHASDAVNRALGLSINSGRASAHFPSLAAQEDYLQGRLFADQPHNEINLRRAQSHFESALRRDPEYGAAYAGLCAVILDAVWADDEKKQLEDAEKLCAKARALDPESSETMRAQGWFLNRSGRAREAIEVYARAVKAEPADMESVLGLANSEFDLFRITGEKEWGTRSVEHARMATTLTPKLAKPFMWLATYQWHVISVDAAAETLQKAYALDPRDEILIANLGSAYLCRGDFEKARDLYLKAREASPGSYIGNEFLGSVYFYLRDYAESARLRQASIDTATSGGGGEIHQKWGDLGDSYRRLGDRERATKAYRQALEIVERDFLLGNGSIGDKAWRAYYYLRLSNLTGAKPASAIARTLDDDLDEAYEKAAEPSAFLRAALAWTIQKRPEKAKASLDKAAMHCPGYLKHPDVLTP